MTPMNPRSVSSNDSADCTEAKYEYADTTLSTFPYQGSTNSLSTLVRWFTPPEGAVQFEAESASYEVLPFTNFNFIITMLLTQEISCIYHP